MGTANHPRLRLGMAVLMLLVAAVAASACGDDSDSDAVAPTTTNLDPAIDPAEANRDSLWETLDGRPEFKPLAQALAGVGLEVQLDGSAKFTVLAPPAAAVRGEGLAGDDTKAAQDLWSHHIIAGRHAISDLADGQVLTTTGGARLVVRKPESGAVSIGNAKLVQPNVLTRNGVIHIVDAVIDPDADPER